MQLSEYLARNDLTLSQFGKAVNGASESTVKRWRDGAIFPAPDRIEAIETATSGLVTYHDFRALRAMKTKPKE